MAKLAYKGYMKGEKLTICVNLTDYGQGWKALDIPIRNRRTILKELDQKIRRYRNDSNYRRNIGPHENVDAWLNDIVRFAA